MSELEKQFVNFGFKLFDKLSTDGQNLVVSPLSLSTCLSMAFMGTRNTSADEMANCLFGKTIATNQYEVLAKELHDLNDKCIRINSSALSCANLMYTQHGFDLLPAFQNLLQTYFAANAKSMDFLSPDSVDVINADISKASNNKINKILDQIEEDTVVILANVLHFKGLWRKKFRKESTNPDVFTTSGNQQINVQMMYQKNKYPFGYSQRLKARVVELNYDNSDAVMIVLLPDENHSLSAMKQSLTVESLNDLLSTMRTIDVDLYLPKFKIESSLDLIDPLKNLGIKSVFDVKTADFTGLSHKSGLCVSKVIQKAVIEVTEEGTEAAAATVVGIALMSVPFTEIFKANRPFMYLLVTKHSDKQINSIVFMGECYNPNK